MTKSEELLNELIATLEKEIAELTEKEKEISFALKVKRAQLKKYKATDKE